jgi:hypothetical protein
MQDKVVYILKDFFTGSKVKLNQLDELVLKD